MTRGEHPYPGRDNTSDDRLHRQRGSRAEDVLEDALSYREPRCFTLRDTPMTAILTTSRAS
jgi:hypothetical protein